MLKAKSMILVATMLLIATSASALQISVNPPSKQLKAPWNKGGMQTGKYRNILAELGYSQKQIDDRINQVCYELFEGPDKIYFEVGDSMGYISDVKNNDARTEGMSYGMMIAVQLGRKDMFDRLWRWSKKYMQHQDGDLKGYFAWSCRTDGRRNSQGPASDGELYYITSLLFASNLWGNNGDINYLAEAQFILNNVMGHKEGDRGGNLINMEHKLITFVPSGWGANYTDPSYHLPAFYEVWARYANDGRSEFWKECAAASRAYLHKATHPQTGLNNDYSNFDGSALPRRGFMGSGFRFDSWRVPMNIALDYSWSCADREWQNDYANRIQNFFYSQGVETFVDQYNADGTAVTDTLRAGNYPKNLRHSLGLVATTAAVSLAATNPHRAEFINHFWASEHKPYADGYFDAYYDGLLQLFAYLHLSGRYRVIEKK
jgi:oligosaccharide reducing-end xylanase